MGTELFLQCLNALEKRCIRATELENKNGLKTIEANTMHSAVRTSYKLDVKSICEAFIRCVCVEPYFRSCSSPSSVIKFDEFVNE